MSVPLIHLFCLIGCAAPCFAMPLAVAEAEVAVVVTGEVKALTPRWSPDGKNIAFALPGNSGIGVVPADGGGCRILSKEPGSGYQFAWSPDSKRIAFRTAVDQPGAKSYRIRTVAVESGEIDSSTEAQPGLQPPIWQSGPLGMRWAACGRVGEVFGEWLAFSGGPAEIFPPLVAYRERNLWIGNRKLSEKAGLHPRWSPDGTALLFDSQDTISLTYPASDQPVRLLCVGNHPAWSPDGQWIVYQITRDHTHEGTDSRVHTPDTLPHVHDDKTNHQIVDSELWLIRPDGTGRVQLTATPDVLEVDPHWAPDGRRIVCTTEDTGTIRVITFPDP